MAQGKRYICAGGLIQQMCINIDSEPGIVLGARYTSVNKTGPTPCPWGQRINEIISSILAVNAMEKIQ